jgi:alcohol dehydrogenase YqhD (iron-dependent ADH family)
MSLPWHQTVNGAIDAITHTQEFYFMGDNEEISLSMDEAIIRTIIKCVDKLKIDENDYNSRANLAWSATLALNGISCIALRGGDWATHRIEHAISALHPEVAHGAGLGVIMPAWIKYVYKYNQKTFERWAKEIWNEDTVDSAIQKLKEKYRFWSAPTTLRELGISENEIQSIAKNALLNGIIGNLKNLSFVDIVEILKIAY